MPFSNVSPRPCFLERLAPAAYRSEPSRVLRSIVRHKRFRTVFDVAIVLNAFFIGLDMDGGEVRANQLHWKLQIRTSRRTS